MSEIARLANQLRKLESLIFRSNRALKETPKDAYLPHNIQGLESLRRQLEARFQVLASRSWLDVCQYGITTHSDEFISIRELTDTLGGFHTAVGLTLDALINGRPKDRARISKTAGQEASLRIGYPRGGDQSGELSFTMVVEKRKDLFEPVNESINTIFEIAEAHDTPQIFDYSQKLGPAPIRAIADWSYLHAKHSIDSRLDWVRERKVERTLAKTSEQWMELKDMIAMVSDDFVDEIQVVGTLIAANVKTGAFVIQAEDQQISGKFKEGVITQGRTASIPKDYKFTIERKERKNYATERTTVTHTLLALSTLRS